MKNPSDPKPINRRQFLKYALYMTAMGVAAPYLPAFSFADETDAQSILTRAIPKTGEKIPMVGMGTWQTFHVGDDKPERDQRAQILKTFFDMGGGMIDSSPMYGHAEDVIGYCLKNLKKTDSMFSATKVWTPFQAQGINQLQDSHRLWGVDQFDLLQIHNLLAWKDHLETLKEWKKNKLVRYLGITTSHRRRHAEFAELMETLPIDFVQFTYNILDREAEERLLPLARKHKLAVIANRPFQGGLLFKKFEKHPLPTFAKDFDCDNWAQFFLKFIISHPDVTCAIPATSRVDHMKENMGALQGRLPNQAEREKMIDYIGLVTSG